MNSPMMVFNRLIDAERQLAFPTAEDISKDHFLTGPIADVDAFPDKTGVP